MVKKEMYIDIKKLKNKGYSKRQIAKELGLNKRTVTKYYHMSEEEYSNYKREHLYKEKNFDKYEKEIMAIYERNGKKRINIASIYDYLEEQHGELPGSERSLRNFITYLVDTSRLTLVEEQRVYEQVPELPPGKQMQLDFGQYKCRKGFMVYIFAALLSYSRYKFIVLQSSPFKTKEVILYLLDCFDYFGGIPLEMVIDQDKLMVVSENKGDIIYTKDFEGFIQEMDIQMRVCRAADPESKGKIENLVGYVKKNFFVLRDFSNVEEANTSLKQWLSRRANGKISQATKTLPNVVIKHEREYLRPLKNSIYRKDSSVGREKRTVSDKGYIAVMSSQYLLPLKYRNKDVDVYVTDKQLFVFDLYSGAQIADYALSALPGKIISKREFKRESEVSLKEIKTKVEAMFPLENWAKFIELNFKHFHRYSRDQGLDAIKRFNGKEISHNVLDEALKYCIANKTLSVANLSDTYQHYIKMHEEAKELLPLEEMEAELKGNIQIEKVDVKRRSFEVYKAILKNKGNN